MSASSVLTGQIIAHQPVHFVCRCGQVHATLDAANTCWASHIVAPRVITLADLGERIRAERLACQTQGGAQ